MDSLWQDVRYALRGLRKQPAFTALAVFTLALGIGAATTIFSVIQNVLLDPFPYKDANRVVAVQIRNAERPDQQGRSYFQVPEFLDYVEQSGMFEDYIAGTQEELHYTLPHGTELITGGAVSGNNFSFLGVPAVFGRTLTPDDARPDAPAVCVMSYKMWRKFFNLDPAVIDQEILLNGAPTRVVGVMPPRFTKLNADVYRPIVLDRANPQVNERYFLLQGKLKRGMTVQRAEAEFTVLAERLSKVYPRNYPPKFVVKVVSWVDNIVGQFRTQLYLLAGAVALLLLIACSNVANMLLARATTREKEMAIRSSLGGSRFKLLRQLLTESVLLALLGTSVGCGFAYFGIRFLKTAIPDGLIPHETDIRLNPEALVFSLVAAAATAIIFGLVPALQATGRDIVEPLKDASKGASGGFRRAKLRSALVITEVALSLILLASAGLLMRSFIKLATVDIGFDPDRLVVARVPLPANGPYQGVAGKKQFFGQIVSRLQTQPGVEAVATISSLPPLGGPRSEIDIIGLTHTERWDSNLQLSSEGVFPTLGVRLLRGRFFDNTEVADARHVAVVNETFVKRYVGAENPIGKRVIYKFLGNTPEFRGQTDLPSFEIIGVVSDVRNRGLEEPPAPESYLPYTITGVVDRGVLLRTRGRPDAMVNTLRQEIWAVDRSVAFNFTQTVNSIFAQFLYAGPRFTLIVFGVFASVGLALVALGVYGVIAYSVSRQTHEIGIRMALGASRADVLGMVLRAGMLLVAVGAVIGLVASLFFTRLLKQYLWQIGAHDPLTLGIVVATLGLVGLVACYFPARRATRVNPLIALRAE